MAINMIRPEQFLKTSWSGGTTEEILIYPPEASYKERNFIYRISTAVVASEQSTFTPLPEFTRYIAPLNGNLSLTLGLRKIELQPFEGFEFDGAEKVTSIARPGLRDLNLMVRKGHLGSLRLSSTELVLDPSSTQVILCLKLDVAGEFKEITEVLVIPKGTIPDDFEPSKAWFKGETLFAVFTLPEAFISLS